MIISDRVIYRFFINNMTQQIEDLSGADHDMANNLLIHENFETMDELLVVPKSMPNFFENNAKDGPPVDAMGNIDVNDDDVGTNLIGLQEVCQPLYPCTHSKTCCYNVVDEHLHSSWG
jgi:hypothetical protein